MADDDPLKHTRQLRKAYTSESAEEIRDYYDDWAGDYESHMAHVGYTHPAMVAAMLARHVPSRRRSRARCGRRDGHHGGAAHEPRVPPSPRHRQLAEDAGDRGEKETCTGDLRQMTLGEPLDFADDHFAAVVSAGVFTQGHAPLSGFDELIRITRPGGHIVLLHITHLPGGRPLRRERRGRSRRKDAGNACRRIGHLQLHSTRGRAAVPGSGLQGHLTDSPPSRAPGPGPSHHPG